ncbi:MAG: hypothetical protein K0Q49_557 [Haloplasmataceae bacterium]|nr:hypothetical protein [Haloplasmataceae bacterium]
MFFQLRKKIISHIVISSILFTVIISIVSFTYVSISIYKNFKYSANENIEQSIKNSSFSINATKNSTILIIEDQNFIESLGSFDYNPKINPILNTLKNTSYGILGVTIYTNNNYIYSTSSISSYLTFNEIKENIEIANFINSDETTYLSIRTSHIADLYYHVKYDEQYGMITYIVKIIDQNNQIQGYLFVDINPSFIYNNFFSYNRYENFQNVETYILAQDGHYLKSEKNSEVNTKYLNLVDKNESRISIDGKYLIISKDFSIEDSSIITLIPLKSYYYDILLIAIVLTIISIILSFIAKIIAIKIADSIANPLSDLLSKMNETDIMVINKNKT